MRVLGIGVAAVLAAGSAAAQDAALAQRGQAVYAAWCTPCHGGAEPRGQRSTAPGTASLEIKYKGEKPALLERRTDLTAPVLKVLLRNGSASMPAFRKVEVSDADIEAIAAYLAQTSAKPAR
jgi:(+)-pinoresinol hydroxylase